MTLVSCSAVLTSLVTYLSRAAMFREGPENEDDDEEEDIEEEIIDESEEEETMPPTKSSKTDANAAKPSSKKKKAAGASTTTHANAAIPNKPFSQFLLIHYKQVSYTLGNGESYTDVNLYGSGYSDTDDFKFDLVGESNLSFAQAIPASFFNKYPPDHENLSKEERKSLKNDSRTVAYANIARTIHSELKYDTNAKGPHFAPPQVIALEKPCERIVDWGGVATPTGHIVTTDDGKKHKQFMTTYWCKLKEVGEVKQRQRKGGNQVVVAGGSFDDDDDDDSRDDGSSSSSDESSVAPPRKQGGGGGGGKRGGGGGAGTTTKKSKQGGSKSKSHAAFVKPEPNIKSEGATCSKREPGAYCGISDLIEILSQSSTESSDF